NPSSRFRSIAFTHNGFNNWKKVHDGCNCAFLTHIGKDPNSLLNNAQRTYVDLMNQAQHIKVSLDRQTTQQISANCLRLKTSIDVVRWLSFQGFDIQNIRGQGYDGASNMCGEFNGLQALILNDCRYAYYVHCFAHRLQLALVAAAREVVEVHQFFKDLSDIVNIASSSSKRHDELQKAQAAEITRLVSINELATGIGMNKIGTLQRPVLRITDNLCQALQRRSQDILNAMSLVLTTKDLIQKLRDDGWNELLKNVISFCETWELDFPDMNAQYIVGRSRNKKEDVTVEHHY
ncbi:hypothetical protein J1N35_044862, partial [Gossypium stocksii]